MFQDSPKDLYNKYHDANNQTARDYWYTCLQVRLQTGFEKEKVKYYLNKINVAKAAADKRKESYHEQPRKS